MATYKVRIKDKEYEVAVLDSPGGTEVTVEGRTFSVEVLRTGVARHDVPSLSAGSTPPAAVSPRPVAPAPSSDRPGAIHAPIPGVVTKVCVATGQVVAAGDIVIKLEAMKMENDIATPVAGNVREIAVSAGTEVRDGQLLVVIE